MLTWNGKKWLIRPSPNDTPFYSEVGSAVLMPAIDPASKNINSHHNNVILSDRQCKNVQVCGVGCSVTAAGVGHFVSFSWVFMAELSPD